MHFQNKPLLDLRTKNTQLGSAAHHSFACDNYFLKTNNSHPDPGLLYEGHGTSVDRYHHYLSLLVLHPHIACSFHDPLVDLQANYTLWREPRLPSHNPWTGFLPPVTSNTHEGGIKQQQSEHIQAFLFFFLGAAIETGKCDKNLTATDF